MVEFKYDIKSNWIRKDDPESPGMCKWYYCFAPCIPGISFVYIRADFENYRWIYHIVDSKGNEVRQDAFTRLEETMFHAELAWKRYADEKMELLRASMDAESK